MKITTAPAKREKSKKQQKSKTTKAKNYNNDQGVMTDKVWVCFVTFVSFVVK
jgi:hypothetical protein